MPNIIINNKPYTKDCKGFYIMPNKLHFLLDDLGLSAQEKLIYECLVRYSNNSENNPFPSYSTIQRFASCGRNTVAKGLKFLQEIGLVVVLEKGSNLTGKSNIYRINYVHDKEQQEPQKASESILDIEDIKPLPQQKEQLQKARNKKYNGMDSGVVIPWKRGVHDGIVTSKEAKEMLNYYESDEYMAQVQADEEAIERLFGL